MSAPIKPSRLSAEETARYIGGLAKELRTLAVDQELGFLAYLLAMVEDDAPATVRRLNEQSSDSKAA